MSRVENRSGVEDSLADAPDCLVTHNFFYGDDQQIENISRVDEPNSPELRLLYVFNFDF